MKGKELTVIERAAVALGTPEHEKKLRELVTQSASIVEIKNADARTQCHSAYMTLKNARVEIEKAGKAAREDATAFSKAIIDEQKRLVEITTTEEARLQGLRDEWDEAREAEKRAAKEAEERRVANIKAKIEGFMLSAIAAARGNAAHIDAFASHLSETVISMDEFAEFTGEAQAKRDNTVQWLRERQAEAAEKEAEAARIAAERAELERLRAEQAERERQAAIVRAEEERRAREIREQDEADRREEQRRADEALRAEREAEAARLRAEREAHEAEMQAQRDEIARQQAEIAAERRRQEQEVEAKRQHEEAMARAEAERERKKQEAKLAEKKRREREQFIEKGPSANEIVDVLAAHYEVERKHVFRWLLNLTTETTSA